MDYQKHKEDAAERSREKSAAGREIGPLPDVVDQERKWAGFESLESFGMTYFPSRFFLPPCPAHREAIKVMESCTNDGGLFCFALMRGGGKTAWAEVAVIRAVAYGLRRFVLLVQATESLAGNSLKKIQREFESNELLLEDFPEVCYPIRRLERIHNRAKGQTLDGEPTRIEWTADGVVLPSVRGAASSGAIIRVAGLTGAIRGLSVSGPNGEMFRPDMLVIDDAQTRASAKSPTQTSDRETLILDDLMGLAGPTTTIAAVNLCTPMYTNDLAERFLDTEKRPDWRGIRTSLLSAFPTNLAKWDEYYEERRSGLRENDGGKRGNEFYLANIDTLQAGAVVTWPERKKKDDVDGLQTAMNLYYANPRGFAAEYQCRPEAGVLGENVKEMVSTDIAKRLNGVPRYMVPKECSFITAAFDPGIWVCWYSVIAWSNRFGGAVIDYGCWPRQARSNFAASDARPCLRDHYKGFTDKQIVFQSLNDIVPHVLGKKYYQHETGEEMVVSKAIIDRGYEKEAVHQYIRQSAFVNILHASKGFARSKTQKTGVGGWAKREGEQSGDNWKITKTESGVGRMIQFDADDWKTTTSDLLTAPLGGMGALTLWGNSAADHEMFSEHVCAEYATLTSYGGASFYSWSVKPGGPDNHFLDVAVLNALAASVSGLKMTADITASTLMAPSAKPISLRDMQEQRRREKDGGGRQSFADQQRQAREARAKAASV
jgi:hypothetical protein